MADSELVKRLVAMVAENKIEDGAGLLSLSASYVPDTVELGKLDWSPKKNWVDQNPPGLPKYIEKVAIGIMKGSGKTREEAIPIAISRIKVWAPGKGVNADTQALAVKALAEWQALKASAAAKRAARGKK